MDMCRINKDSFGDDYLGNELINFSIALDSILESWQSAADLLIRSQSDFDILTMPFLKNTRSNCLRIMELKLVTEAATRTYFHV